jgi:hypothetical protein
MARVCSPDSPSGMCRTGTLLVFWFSPVNYRSNNERPLKFPLFTDTLTMTGREQPGIK